MRALVALAGLGLGFSIAAAAPAASAQDFPTRPITLIHGFAAGAIQIWKQVVKKLRNDLE